jgi:methionyl-tRNA formyltransferase
LHILFCGSDEFSCASLEALHAEHQQNPELIKSIDVVVRPGKPTGRGHKKIRHRESSF